MAEDNRTWLVRAIVQGVFITLLATALGAVFSARVTEAIAPPTCDATKDLASLRPADQEASSSRDPEHDSQGRELTYGADRVVDGDTATGWAEGAPGLGLNESLTFHFDHPVALSLLCIVNGYGQSWPLYTRNPRVRALAVTASQDEDVLAAAPGQQRVLRNVPTQGGDTTPDGAANRLLTLTDAGTQDHVAVFQTAEVDFTDVRTLTLRIVSVYSGVTVDRFPDTSISEIEFWGSP
ncbi:hypothetical protein ASH01_21150 [Terrabacter sp. Soil811]|uniref:NADase-type glycan-binding domain-containing protein n=1 Tax=Terrabacter sp. Soil811 TaxID=1736419 RepID=UPI0006F33068|nr:hypothetical protein [Terrabacter sp. Soil811]KRF47715.1 hypothetical protein ASH01_21150 [Terrabacter sp. Soil811]